MVLFKHHVSLFLKEFAWEMFTINNFSIKNLSLFLAMLMPLKIASSAHKNQRMNIYAESEIETVDFKLSFAGENIPIHEKIIGSRIIAAVNNLKKSEKSIERSGKWFKVIEPVLIKKGIPQDFKYLAFVESGFTKNVSSKGAGGYWQFMPATARSLGLIVDETKDERYDLLKSTNAACDYFNYLHNITGSWTLAAAAYNLGITRLRDLIKTQGINDYHKLKLNKETQNYIYRIVTVKEIYERGRLDTVKLNNLNYICKIL